MVKQKEKEKERNDKLKALRRELEEKIEENLPPEMLDDKTRIEVSKVDDSAEIDPERAKRIVEALLFAASKPLTPQEIRKVMKSVTVAQIQKIVETLKQEYIDSNCSFEILDIANGYEMSTKKEYAPWILKIELQKKAKQVTQSALECLSILVYKQPVTRAEIEELRGVDVSGVLSTLSERGLVKIVGRKEVPGRPFLYGTTEKFLEHFGLKTLKDLPDIEEIRTLVESSIKREELVGTTNVVEVKDGETAADANVAEATDEVASATEEDVAAETPSEEVEAPETEQAVLENPEPDQSEPKQS